jgi:hypothetical protein
MRNLPAKYTLTKRVLGLAFALATIAACGPFDDDQGDEYAGKNVGDICIGMPGSEMPESPPTDPNSHWSSTPAPIDAGPIESGSPLRVLVTNGYPPHQCNNDALRETCTVTVDKENQIIVVESDWYWHRPEPSSCTLQWVSGGWSTSCEIPEIPDGNYTIKHGNQEVGQLQIPSSSRQQFDSNDRDRQRYDCGIDAGMF